MSEIGVSVTLSAFTSQETGGRTITVPNGDVIFSPDTSADHLYYIQSGQVRLYSVRPDDSSRMIDIFGPGQWFGAAALAGLKTFRMRAVAVSNTVVVQVRIDKFLATLARNPAQCIELIRQVALKLMTTAEEGSRLVFEDCNQRVINALLRFSESAASTRREDGLVVLRITHDQLAQVVGVARETVSLALTQLRTQKVLRTGRNQLMFNPTTLKQCLDKAPGIGLPSPENQV
jgi:CRP/FNR family transcriptional regulator